MDNRRSRSEQRRTTQMLKPKKVSTNESHIPRPRFRSSSSDRASSVGRISYLKPSSAGLGRTPLRSSTNTATPLKGSAKLTLPSSGRSNAGRSPSSERAVGKGPRKDTRPLTDKSYQMELLKKIDNFFYINQHTTMLNSNGSLKPITLKMFVEVSALLLKILDIKQELTMVNYIEELPKCAKKLHYPGMMNKSWLKTANTMHSWPNVLGWIGWLVEACQVKEIAFNAFQLETIPFVGTEQQAETSKIELTALLECYKAWNEERLDDEAELLEKYQQDIANLKGVSEKDIVQARQQLEENAAKLKITEEESRQLDEEVKNLSDKLSSLRDKEAVQLNNIKEKEEYIERVSAETKQLLTETAILNEQLSMANIQYENLLSTVKNQPMSKTEKEKILKQCTEIQNYIHGFDEHLTEYQKELYTLDINLAACNNNLNKAVWAYNKEIFMHVDNDIGVNFNELKLPEEGLLNPQIMDVMKEKVVLMNKFKELLAKQCSEVDSRINSETMKLEKLQQEVKSFEDEEKLKGDKSHIDKMKADLRNKEIELTRQIEILKNEIEEMKNMMPDIGAMDLEIEEAQDKLDAVTRRHAFLEQAAERFFDKFYKIIGEHRSELHDILTRKKRAE